MNTLWSPVKVGKLSLNHRLAMAPMTRSRAKPDGTPGDSAPEYYAQRASLGLLIAEGTQPSEDGQGYTTTPGIYTDAHVKGWKKVTEAVHKAGGHLYIQVMHAGRISHPDNTPHHRQPVAPSAISADQPMFTPTGMQKTPEPRALTTAEVKQTVKDFAYAARRAIEAGADGVEIHGANGYLIQQFLAPNANTRSDEYGGSIENRARFALEVAAAVAVEIGADRTGIRLSPLGNSGGLDEGQEAPQLYRYLVAELNKLNLAYLHILHTGNEDLLRDLRAAWKHPLLVNRPGAPREALARDVKEGLAELVPVGKLALANPDLVIRLKNGAPLNEPNPASFFGGTEAGYTDYPVLAA
ncbi:alkene reductase [Aestuariivirga sp.]|uniref:alkene reductase n=1 Tax=Aestuariivirga sp. TaxID=2650926 RepID=UPI003BAD32A6